MTRTTAVRLGIPIRGLARRILIPVGAVLFLVVSALSIWQFERVQKQVYQDQRSVLRTVFEFSPAVHNGSSGLATMARNRGYERIWVLSATGDILESSRPQEIGTRLEDRWWSVLKDQPSGLHQETVRFGNQDLELLSLNSVEMGRQVAIVSRQGGGTTRLALNVGLILVAGLILWIFIAGVLLLNLRRRIERPSRNLDGRALELVRGGTLTDVQLDRIHAEVVDGLGGHADCMVDLARKVQKQDRSIQQSSSRYGVLFNALPSPAFILDPARRVIDANEALAEAMGIETAWLRGRELSVLGEWIPTDRLNRWLDKTSSTPVGIRRMRSSIRAASGSPDDSREERIVYLTIAPLPATAGRGHLIIVEDRDGDAGSALEDDTDRTSSTASAEVVSDDAAVSAPFHPYEESHPVGTEDLPTASGDGQTGPPPAHPVLDSRTHSSEEETGPVSEPLATFSSDGPEAGLADIVLQAAGVVAVAFNEEAATIFWSEGGARLTGLSEEDIPDLKAFTNQLFPHDKERNLFRTWLDSEPDDRSQELKIRTKGGIESTVWRAGEWHSPELGEIGVLWTHAPSARMKTATTPDNAADLTDEVPEAGSRKGDGEPAVPSGDS